MLFGKNKMNDFTFYGPTRIIFGCGKLCVLGEEVKKYGNKALLVTGRWTGNARQTLFQNVKEQIEKEGVTVTVYDGAIPNPTVKEVAGGTETSRASGCDVIVGFGGGSAMDVAKAIAVNQTHDGAIWDYVYFQEKQPTSKTLPIVLVTTTSGTGSHVSKCSVITNPENNLKVGIVSDNIFAKVSIVDPELTVSVPKKTTASTGFDVFTHAFESYINASANPMIDTVALESIKLVVEFLPGCVDNGSDLEARTMMALADTFAGISIANVGTTLPHSMGQPISGHFHSVSHGEALSVVYPAIMEFSYSSSIEKFARVARIFNPALNQAQDEEAARGSVKALRDFLKRIGLTMSLHELNISNEVIPELSKDAAGFPDTDVHPKVASQKEIENLYLKCVV